MLNDIKVILSHTSHPGNIGAAARAMKTMGLKHLVLVNPKRFPCEEAIARSSGALDILDQAEVVDSLEAALKGCRLIIGTSSRHRYLSFPLIEPREMAQIISERESDRPVAIIFGRESSGLLNEELELCHYHVNIPANPDYMSLNLASAVQVIAYELRVQSLLGQNSKGVESGSNDKDSEQAATFDKVEGLYQHLLSTMAETEFYDPEEPKLLPSRIRRLLAKTQPNRSELNILRGFLTSISSYIKRNSKA